MRDFHIILVVNPGDTLHTVTTVYVVDHKGFPDETEEAMTTQRPQCAVCNLGGRLVDEFISETDDTRAVIVVVRHVPAQVCDRCGTTTLTDQVADELARIADAQQGDAVSGTVVVDFGHRQVAAVG